ncbi:MAG: hypothetical protein V3V18_14000 [Methylococcales bacterium]
MYIEQLYPFGEPQRDPRERVISVVYLAIIPAHQVFDNFEQWHSVDDMPRLAFDHSTIVIPIPIYIYVKIAHCLEQRHRITSGWLTNEFHASQQLVTISS